jgi:hypothetical protein
MEKSEIEGVVAAKIHKALLIWKEPESNLLLSSHCGRLGRLIHCLSNVGSRAFSERINIYAISCIIKSGRC